MLFAEVIQIALGHRDSLSTTPSLDEWQKIFLLSKKQALLGITYKAIEQLPTNQRPSRQLLLQWCLASERIKERNEYLNTKVIEISRKFHDNGFRNIILKGQGIAQYYRVDNLNLYRTPGDVDIWFDGCRKDIISYVRKYLPDCNAVYHHIDFPKIDDVHIEIHFTPSWMNSYFTNKKLQRFFNNHKESLFTLQHDNIPTPTIQFNRVYILVHIYRHLFHEGIGLRQLMDYYYVLRQGFTTEEREEAVRTLCFLKMQRFTSAIMWILRDFFGLEEYYLIMQPNESDGRFLLEEVMQAGNLGLYDRRITRGNNESDISHGLRKVKRNLRFIHSYPSEVLWSPIFKIWHYLWRKVINNVSTIYHTS